MRAEGNCRPQSKITVHDAMSEKFEAIIKNTGSGSLNPTQLHVACGPHEEHSVREDVRISTELRALTDLVANPQQHDNTSSDFLFEPDDDSIEPCPWLHQRHQLRRLRDWHGMKSVSTIVHEETLQHVCDIEDLVEDTAKPTGRHRAHDIRGKSSKSLRKDFTANKVNDEFVKEDLERSLWYAKEFFLKKQGFEHLKEPRS